VKIAILSDTHGWLDEQLLAHVQEADEIWHAGDVGNIEVIETLGRLPGKLRVVYGNIDDQPVRQATGEWVNFTAGGLRVLITHIAGRPPRYNARVRQKIAEHQPDLLVCGHSHILKVMPDKANSLLFINPGACGHHGFHKIRTIITLQITAGKPHALQVVELGKRGRISTQPARPG